LADSKFMYELNDFCVIAILSKGDSYGYQINQELLEVLDMSESTLYPILKKLEKQGNVESYSSEHGGRLRRYCKLTEQGKLTVESAKLQWQALRDWIDTKFEEESTNEQS
jgi:PadR family transcriptional regulator PadR